MDFAEKHGAEGFGPECIHYAWLLRTVVKGWYCFMESASKRPLDTTEKEDCHVGCMAVTHRTASVQKFKLQLVLEWYNDRHPVVCVSLTVSHSRLQRQWCHARSHWRVEICCFFWCIPILPWCQWWSCVGQNDAKGTLATKVSAAWTHWNYTWSLRSNCLWQQDHSRDYPKHTDYKIVR